MNPRLQKGISTCIILMVVIILFTIIDYFIHGLENYWSVPDYYFKNKIPFGFLWGLVGLFIASKYKNIWLKSLIFSGTIAVTLQIRYFIEGYALDFVLIFLLFHFLTLYFLSLGMFKIFEKY